MKHLTLYQQLFWDMLSTRISLGPLTPRQKVAAAHWISAAATDPDRAGSQVEILRVLEDTVLDGIDLLFDSGSPQKSVRSSIIVSLIPLLDGSLLQNADSTLVRLVTDIIALEHQRGLIITARKGDDEEYTVSLPESNQEALAIRLMRESIERTGVLPRSIDFDTYEFRVTDGPYGIEFSVTVPLVNVLIADDRFVQRHVATHLMALYSMTDPGLASAIRPLLAPRLGTSTWQRRRAIQEFEIAYLRSGFFELRRDIRHGLVRISRRPIAFLDTICGLDFASIPSEQALEAAAAQSFCGGLHPSTNLTLHLLRIRDGDDVGEAAKAIARLWAEIDDPESRQGFIRNVSESVAYSHNVFHGLFSLLLLLCVSAQESDLTVSTGNGNEGQLLRDWLENCINYLLSAASRLDDPELRLEGMDPETESTRRNVHALVMRLAFWVAGSAIHVRELTEGSGPGDHVVVGWLLRGLAFTDRLLLMILLNGEQTVDAIRERVVDVAESLGLGSGSDAYPDVLDPFLYGTESFDHCLAMTLSLLGMTWGLCGGSETTRAFWWSERIEAAVRDLASRPAFPAEELLVKRRSGENHNRLGIALVRTVPEEAWSLLSKAGLYEEH